MSQPNAIRQTNLPGIAIGDVAPTGGSSPLAAGLAQVTDGAGNLDWTPITFGTGAGVPGATPDTLLTVDPSGKLASGVATEKPLETPTAAAMGNYTAFGTVRQPSTTRPVLVVADVVCTGGPPAIITAYCDPTTPGSTIVDETAIPTVGGNAKLILLCPPGFKYVLSLAGTGSINTVAEYTL